MTQEQQGSWLTLFGFCTLTVLASALGFGIVLAGVSAVFAGSQAAPVQMQAQVEKPPLAETSAPTDSDSVGGEAGDQTFSGMITDSGCGARHSRDSDKTSAECARSCVRHGARYVLVDGDVTHFLAGKKAQVEKLAGQRVEVVGALERDTIRVKAVIAR
jgi:hypothetical protein